MTAMEKTLVESNNSKASRRNFRLVDLCVVIFCISGAAFSLNLFRLDLFQSIASQNKKPIGTVTVKYNNVQRRLSDRVLWSRLTVESPVYLGDLIRVAGYSAATLYINDDIIDIDENTLIRIRVSEDGDGRIVIDLASGSLNVSGGASGGISDDVDSDGAAVNIGASVGSGAAKRGVAKRGVALNIMGRLVEPQAGTTLSASAGENGMTVQVNEGNLIIKEKNGLGHLFSTGEKLVLDSGGVEHALPMAVVTLPRPNARFIKNGTGPLEIPFAWSVTNLDQKQPLRLEIAADAKFMRVGQTIEGVGFANAALGAGTWYWRLSYNDTALSAGQFIITDAAVSALLSPIDDTLFRYRENPPDVRFEWKPVGNASGYILEADLAPDLSNPLITRQTAVASFVEPALRAGTWYWRVKPVFSALYGGGSAVFSRTASFRVEQIAESNAVAANNISVTMVLPESRPESKPAVVSELVAVPAPRPAVVPAPVPVPRPPEPAPRPAVVPAPVPAPKPPEPAPRPAVVPAPVPAPKPPEPAPRPAVVPTPTPAPRPPEPAFLPEAEHLLPAEGRRIGVEDFKTTRKIDFSWAPVEGANAYVLTLYQQDTAGTRKQILKTAPLQKTEWTLEDLALLDSGTFIWQVEAVNIDHSGGIERQGKVKENTFVVDIPRPSRPEIEDIGTLYEH
jgi:hypothetical protein